MTEGSRRYTDREVALVLRRATELDELDGAAGEAGSGLSLADLRQIAGEVGVSAGALERALATLDRPDSLSSHLAGAPAVRKAVHVVDGELDREGIAALVATVDEHADGTGAVTEALGSVRWTARDRLKSTRVSITPRRGTTAIEVVEKAEPRLRRIFHALPAAWGVTLAGVGLAAAPAGPLGSVVVAVLAAAVGAGVGRGVWALLSTASDQRVHRLAERLASEAAEAAEAIHVPIVEVPIVERGRDDPGRGPP